MTVINWDLEFENRTSTFPFDDRSITSKRSQAKRDKLRETMKLDIVTFVTAPVGNSLGIFRKYRTF